MKSKRQKKFKISLQDPLTAAAYEILEKVTQDCCVLHLNVKNMEGLINYETETRRVNKRWEKSLMPFHKGKLPFTSVDLKKKCERLFDLYAYSGAIGVQCALGNIEQAKKNWTLIEKNFRSTEGISNTWYWPGIVKCCINKSYTLAKVNGHQEITAWIKSLVLQYKPRKTRWGELIEEEGEWRNSWLAEEEEWQRGSYNAFLLSAAGAEDLNLMYRLLTTAEKMGWSMEVDSLIKHIAFQKSTQAFYFLEEYFGSEKFQALCNTLQPHLFNLACLGGELNIIQGLVKFKSSENFFSAKKIRNPLRYACESGNLATFEYILKHLPKNELTDYINLEKDHYSYSLLGAAILGNNPEIIDRVLQLYTQSGIKSSLYKFAMTIQDKVYFLRDIHDIRDIRNSRYWYEKNYLDLYKNSTGIDYFFDKFSTGDIKKLASLIVIDCRIKNYDGNRHFKEFFQSRYSIPSLLDIYLAHRLQSEKINTRHPEVTIKNILGKTAIAFKK